MTIVWHIRLRGRRPLRGAGLIGLLLTLLCAGPAHAEERIADIRQGTNLTLSLAPDGETLVVALLGRLWQLPASGGGATLLTPAGERARHPRMSPDGSHVVYQRHVDGQWELWLLDLQDRSRRQLTDARHNDREPDFTPDGRAVVFASDRDGHYSLYRLDLAAHAVSRLTAEPGEASFPAVSERDEIAYVLQRDEQWSLRILTGSGASVELLTSRNRLSAPSWRPGGGVIVYNEHEGARASFLRMLVLANEPLNRTLARSEDVFAGRAAWLSPAEYLYAADGQIWRRGIAHVTRWPVHLFAAVTVPAHQPPHLSTPLDAPGPHPMLGSSGHSRSADGRVTVFTALGSLWLSGPDIATRRLTDGPAVDFAPAVMPDGGSVVFASDRTGTVDLWQLDIATAQRHRLTDRAGKAWSPAVSPDSTRLAFLETEGLGPWAPARLLLMSLGPGNGTVREITGGVVGATGLSWNVDGDGIGVERRVNGATGEIDVTWFDADGGTGNRLPASAPGRPDARAAMAATGLHWQAHAGGGRYVVQAGRLFDGLRSDYQRHVDVHVEGQRITAIVGRNVLPLPETVIDARDLTVIPGLIDLHAHQSALVGERLGRIWLAYGVTTVRELTHDIDDALERSESWASGQRLGPRLVVTPAATATPALAQAPPPVVVQRYPGIADGLAHSLSVQARQLRVSPAPALPLLPALEAVRGLPLHHDPFEVSPLSQSYQDVLGTTIASGVVVTPTLAAIGGLNSLGRQWPGVTRDPAFELLYRPAERAVWVSDEQARSESLGALQQKVARIVRGGGRVAVGTDAPAVPYGLGLHVELTLLARGGIPNDQVLRIATAQAALALGLDTQLGTLEPGKLADFIIIDGNPLERIEDALNIRAVVRGGELIERGALLQPR